MLAEITIKDFAIIDQLTLQFNRGFNVLTGETGAGKSIIMDAVALLLGGRADSEAVREGTSVALIEGIFVLENSPLLDHVTEIVAREELEGDAPDVLTLSREIRSSGRSTARINGRTVPVGLLREIGEGLVDIHGQSEHLSLLKPASHLGLLDRYGGLGEQRTKFGKLVDKVNRVRAELESLRSDEAEREQRIELLTYKVEEIAAARLKPGEDDALREEARLLANAEQLAALAGEAYQAIFGDEEGMSANDRLALAANALSRLVKIDLEAGELSQVIESLTIQVEELGRSLADYEESMEFEPGRLDQVENRIDLINHLLRKYHCAGIEELIAGEAEARIALEAIENSDERIAELEAEEARLLGKLGEKGAALSRARTEAADRLSRASEGELADLKMENARFGVAIEQVPNPAGAPVGEERYAFDHTGIDRVEFLIAPNIGEPLKPIARIASGGETSRIMLALKTVLSRADQTPSLIFDEIDQGIGGRIGAVVGEKLWSLSDRHQVLVVTHLPQLAGFGDLHFKVEKRVVDQRTITVVDPVESDDRIDELAAMLGAEAKSARKSAQEILDYVSQVKQQVTPSG